MQVLEVDHSNRAQLIKYSARHGPEHDESYLPGPNFVPSTAQPSYLLSDGQSLVGAVSLLRSKRFSDAGRGRFAIFHSTLGTLAAYQTLLEAITPHFDGLRNVYLFVPRERGRFAAILSKLGFEVERYSFVLLNRSPQAADYEFPSRFDLRELDRADESALLAYTSCLNESFSELAGHLELPPDEVRGWFDEPTYVEGGILALWRDAEIVGTLSVAREYNDPNLAEISAFGIRKSLRGAGLGRHLLRAGVSTALEKGFHSVILSVNAENELALSLYRSEGFELIETFVCYRLDCF